MSLPRIENEAKNARLLVMVPVAVLTLSLSATAAWWLRGRQPAAPVPAASDESALRQQGKLLYVTSCAGCHGAEGHGDGPSALELKPPPRDFAEGPWKFGATPSAIRKVIRDGIAGTAMPGSPTLSERDLDAMVAHVLTMAPREKAMPSESAALLRRANLNPVPHLRGAPNLELRRLDGKSASLADLKGKTVLLNFWATTCIYCLEELPELERVERAYRDRGLAVVSVCFDDANLDTVAKLVRGRVQGLSMFVNPDGQARLRYDVQVMPVVYLIDAEGQLRGHVQGARKWSDQDIEMILQACQ